VAIPCAGCCGEHLGVSRIYLVEGNKFFEAQRELALKHYQDAFNEMAVAERHARALGLDEFADRIRRVKKEVQAYIARGDRIPTDLIREVGKLEDESWKLLRSGDLASVCPTCLIVTHEAPPCPTCSEGS